MPFETEEWIFRQAQAYKDNQKRIKQLQEVNKTIKGQLIGRFEDIDKKRIINSSLEVKYTTPRSFDKGMFAIEHKDIYAKFTTAEEVVEVVKTFHVKEFKKAHPELHESYMLPLTPRLTIKELEREP